ncbi:MAG: endonuclease/exonuclease/phosphatase family protein [Candidatus Saccharibacteria bacterium]
MKIRVGTWNIAGARKMLSMERFDYGTQEELDYFAEQLQTLQLDIVCLQESHANSHNSLAELLANSLDMSYVAESPGCPSHIDSTYMLTTAIISRIPFTTEQSLLLPHPTFELKFQHSGKVVPPYDRYAQVVTFNSFTVANIHTEPLGAFGLQYDTGLGKDLGHGIDTLLAGALSRPLLFPADFNQHDLSNAFPLLLEKFSLKDALPNISTKPWYPS